MGLYTSTEKAEAEAETKPNENTEAESGVTITPEEPTTEPATEATEPETTEPEKADPKPTEPTVPDAEKLNGIVEKNGVLYFFVTVEQKEYLEKHTDEIDEWCERTIGEIPHTIRFQEDWDEYDNETSFI